MTRQVWVLLALMLTFSGGNTRAQEPVVKEDPVVTDVPLGEAAQFKEIPAKVGVLKKLSSSTSARWILINGGLATLDESDDGKKATFTSPVAGKFEIVVVADQKKVTCVRIVVDGVTPQPQPQPGPQPPPTPTPSGPVFKVVVVEDTSKPGQWRGDVLGSPALAAYVKTNGVKHRLIDINAPENADDEAKAFLDLAKEKQLPWLWTFDKNGVQLSSQKAPTTPAEFVVAIGGEAPHKRAMGNNPPNAAKRLFKVFGDSPQVPVIERKNWKAVDLSAYLPPVYDQDGRGQCNASATCTAIEACRYQAGLQPVKLSAGDLYSQINEGQDKGSTLEDGLYAATTNGVASAATVPYIWDGRNYANNAKVKEERKKYLVLEAYKCPDFDAVASALQQGFFIIEGLLWADNYTPDRDGWLPAFQRGNVGGHALCGYGLVQRNGVWGIKTRNSWNTTWGLGGNCVIPEPCFGKEIGGFWAVRAVVQTGADFPVTPRASLNVRDEFRNALVPSELTRPNKWVRAEPKLLAP